jgi:flagellar biosynthesis protein FlhB
MKTCVRKLFHNFEGDPTVGSKVRALSNRYSGLERRDVRLTEYRFHIYSKENSVRKLFYNFEVDPTVRSKVRALSNRYYGLERQDLRLN